MITSRTIAVGIVKAIGILLLFALLLYFLYKIQTVILYLIIALVFTLIANPVVEFLRQKLKFSNTAAVSVTLVFFMLIIVGILLMFVPLIVSQSNNLSLLNTQAIEKNIVELTNQTLTYLKSHNIDAKKLVNTNINLDVFTSFFNSILTTISNIGVGLASVFFITFFFLKDKVMFLVGAKKILPDAHEEQIINSVTKINELLSRYFIGLLLQLLIIFVLYLIVLLIFGIENALIIAFLCAILNIVPYIGPIISTIIAGFLTMMSHLGEDFQTEILPSTIFVLIGFFIVQLIDNNISQPLIFSKSVNSHPLEIFLVILISGFLFGIMGMVIAVPLFTIIKVVGKEFFPENKIIKQFTKNI
ncbi:MULTISPECIES: AI-2E family transporter [Flavobacterium]|uniref:AI-2E family transporter n=1 Tax=Flavobacterium sedimenticola TaxID=3043286 RepID=A0ABT6XPW1_9FLAO|nr:AI-2E family transporter [Flavobacterium sedimenticola]MDI9257129.1 AI-2E family transporter [Flavobacterium sedimenticola]